MNTDDRYFPGGAYRDIDNEKMDLEGFISPLVIEAFGKYMTHHRVQSDGKLRDSDNWQALFGEHHYDVCIKSAYRHFHDWTMEHDGYESRDGLDEALGGLLFNLQGYWHKRLLEERKLKETKCL